MQPCGAVLLRGFGDLLALMEDVLSPHPMTAIVCEGMRVCFARPHAVTAVAGMFVDKTWEAQSASTGQRLIPSQLWRDASLLLGTTGWCGGGRGSLSTVRSFPPCLLFHRKEPVNEVGKWVMATPHASAH